MALSYPSESNSRSAIPNEPRAELEPATKSLENDLFPFKAPGARGAGGAAQERGHQGTSRCYLCPRLTRKPKVFSVLHRRSCLAVWRQFTTASPYPPIESIPDIVLRAQPPAASALRRFGGILPSSRSHAPAPVHTPAAMGWVHVIAPL